MPSLSSLGRFAIKGLLWSGGVFLGLLLLWLTANRLLDQAPDPAREAFAASVGAQVPDERNIAVGILGLTAPANSDFMEYGKSVKASIDSGLPWSKVREMQTGPKALQLTVDHDQLSCWLEPDLPLFKSCRPFSEAPGVIEQNGELLRRFRALYALDRLAAPRYYYGTAYLDAAKLSVADMQLDLRRHAFAQAYAKWRDQLAFTRRTLQGEDGWVGKYVGFVATGILLPFLDDLVIADPETAKQHQAELVALLRPGGAGDINPEGISRAEYAGLAYFLDHPETARWSDRPVIDWMIHRLSQKNRVLNRYTAFLKEYGKAIMQPWGRVDEEATRLRTKYAYNVDGWDLTIDPIGTVFLSLHIYGELKTFAGLRYAYVVESKLRLASLMVQIAANDVRDADIPAYLKSADRSLWDVFSNSPMRWDAKNRRIYFIDPLDKCMINYVRVPPPKGSGLPPPPFSPPWIC